MAKLKIKTPINLVIVGIGFPDVLNIIDSININSSQIKINLIGFLDDNVKLHSKKIWGHKILGNISWLKNKKEIYVVNSIAKNCRLREQVFLKIKKYTNNFYNLIDPQVSTKNVRVSKGVIINRGVTLGYGAKIGFGSILSWDSHLGHNASIGSSCFLAKGATILGYSKVGNRVFIGSNSSIVQKVKVGNDCNIFSNISVLENLKSNSFIASN